MIPTLRLYKFQGEDRVAELSTEPAHAQAGSWLIRVARGKAKGPLTGGTTFGPFPASDLPARFDEVKAQLASEGFGPGGVGQALADLKGTSSAQRARAARRLGRAGAKEAVPALLNALGTSADEACSILDALGMIGDARAIPAVRAYAERKLLSRRRSAVEALYNLNDHEGLAAARQRAMDGLDDPVKQALALIPKDHLAIDHPADSPEVQALVKSVNDLSPKSRGHAVDTLYEIGFPVTVAAARALLEKLAIAVPNVWRYAKSVLKRAQLRRDFAMVGWLSHAIEVAARKTKGTTANVKSGRDGVTRDTKIFSPKTQRFVRRSVWRQLRQWARSRPGDYTKAAAEALIHYEPADAGKAKGRYGEYAACYLLNRILWGASPRLELMDRSLRYRLKAGSAAVAPDGAREETFSQLWDSNPLPYLRLLSAAKLLDVQVFAARAVALRHPELLEEATLDELLGMLGQTHPQTIGLAAEELETRYDAHDPDWELLERLLSDKQERARHVGQAWLERGAPFWTQDPARSFSWLQLADPETREAVADQLIQYLPAHSPDVRASLAVSILQLLKAPEAAEGAHDAAARVASEALVLELSALVDTATLDALIERGSPAAKSVAGVLLGSRPDALEQLGLARVLGLAENESVSVRAAAHKLVRGAVADLRSEPGLLFLLVESDWPDTRQAAIALLREHLDLATLGLDGVIGLCDSTRIEVQNLGRELLLRHFAEVDASEVTLRLAEHPHANMRSFALDLIEKHLPAGADALRGLTRFYSVVLFDVRPDRDAKRRVIDFLVRRGLEDEEQARVAATTLGELLQTKTKQDFERALAALTQLALEFPGVSSRIAVSS